MRLSRRLKRLADNVLSKGVVADIGCDHGFTSIYLVQQGLADRAIAMDINQGPLNRAKEHIMQYQMQDRISLRLSDGAKKLSPGEVDTLLISGMGGALICRILRESEKVTQSVSELVLSPQSEVHLVRRCIHEMGFMIAAEEMVAEQGKYYVLIRAIPGQEVYSQEVDYIYGKKLIDGRDEVFLRFLQKEEYRVAEVLENMKKQELSAEGKRKKQKLMQESVQIQQVWNRMCLEDKKCKSEVCYGESD